MRGKGAVTADRTATIVSMRPRQNASEAVAAKLAQRSEAPRRRPRPRRPRLESAEAAAKKRWMSCASR
eukprot:9597207-Heterocapsa_arctica.AAC.1